MCKEKKPHVHAELIKAWADGAEIQYSTANYEKWLDVESPLWAVGCLYRIKPEPKPDVVRYGVAGLGALRCGAVEYIGPHNTNPDNNLKLTFDGETGKLKSAEVL